VGVIGMVRDVTERHIAEERFRLIVVCTAASIGTDFFQSLVRHMAAVLRARYAFLTDCDDQKHRRLLALWNHVAIRPHHLIGIGGAQCD